MVGRPSAEGFSDGRVPAVRPLYLDYLEGCVALYVKDRVYAFTEADYSDEFDPIGPALDYLNKLFETRRVSYRFNAEGRAEWHGDQGAYEEIVRPALDSLADTRLAGSRQEFEAALGHLRTGTPKDFEDAIEEAGKAVESAMKAVLDERQVTRTGNETAEPLWNALRDNTLVPPKTKDAILSTSRLRNEYGGHGQGGQVRTIPEEIPALTVRAAAAAIAYLASRLP
ncbi:MAG TPA: hypothetical protein VFA56_13640 [Gaiellaceae bacterium]|nr:hypothetical protein [Gaiellaceae bacterium]